MRVAISNVGERDLRYDVAGQFYSFADQELASLLGCKPGARYIGERIQELLHTSRQNTLRRLRFPIIKPFLDHVLKKYGPIDCLVLVVTDQQQAQERHRRRDTVNAGYVLEELVRDAFGDKVKDTRLLPIIERPNLIEEGYDFFGRALPDRVPSKDEPEVHVLAAGGVPALNYGLTWQALNLYGKACHVYQVTEPTAGKLYGEVCPAGMFKFHRDLVLRMATDLIMHYQYTGALAVLEQAFDRMPLSVENPARCAALRLNLNFSEAAAQLTSLRSSSNLLETWYQWLCAPSPPGYLEELFWQVCIRAEQGAYSDLLWRLGAFYEQVLRLIASEGTGIPELASEKQVRLKWVRAQNADLRSFLDNSQRLRPVGGTWVVNAPFLREVCEYLCAQTYNTASQTWCEIYQLTRPLGRLYRQRNELLHEKSGVSRDTVADVLPITEIRETLAPMGGASGVEHQGPMGLLLALMREIVRRIGAQMSAQGAILGQNPYHQMNEHICQQLRAMQV